MPDSDGDLRCYPADCNLLPAAEECGEDDNYDQYMMQILGNVFTAKIPSEMNGALSYTSYSYGTSEVSCFSSRHKTILVAARPET